VLDSNIDDVHSLNNSTFGDFLYYIYPIELEIKNTTDTDMTHTSKLTVRVVKNETLRQKRWSQIQIDLLHTLTYTSKLTVRSDKNETVRQKRWFQFSHWKSSIYKHYSSSTCSWSIYIYPAINTFAVQICYANNFLLYS